MTQNTCQASSGLSEPGKASTCNQLKLIAAAIREQVIEILDKEIPLPAGWRREVGRPIHHEGVVSFWFPFVYGVESPVIVSLCNEGILGFGIDRATAIYHYDLSVPHSLDDFLLKLSQVVKDQKYVDVSRP